jgi:hypothetical protein
MRIEQLKQWLEEEERRFKSDPQNEEVLGKWEHQEIVMWMWYDGKNHGYGHDWQIMTPGQGGWRPQCADYVADFPAAVIEAHKEMCKQRGG